MEGWEEEGQRGQVVTGECLLLSSCSHPILIPTLPLPDPSHPKAAVWSPGPFLHGSILRKAWSVFFSLRDPYFHSSFTFSPQRKFLRITSCPKERRSDLDLQTIPHHFTCPPIPVSVFSVILLPLLLTQTTPHSLSRHKHGILLTQHRRLLAQHHLPTHASSSPFNFLKCPPPLLGRLDAGCWV